MYNKAYTLAFLQVISHYAQSVRISQATPATDGVTFDGATINGDIHVNMSNGGDGGDCQGDCDIELIHVRGMTHFGEDGGDEGRFEEVDMLLHVDGMYRTMAEFEEQRGEHGGDDHGNDCDNYEELEQQVDMRDVMYAWFMNTEQNPACITEDFIKWVFGHQPGQHCHELKDWMVRLMHESDYNFE